LRRTGQVDDGLDPRQLAFGAAQGNTLQLAIISRIKLYYRPAKLALPPDQAAEKLRFRRSANSLTLINPTPYYLTVTELNAGTRVLENALVPPMG
ncbi:hypothetical protein RJ918_35835, partial [Pseudomonas aeruginosa]